MTKTNLYTLATNKGELAVLALEPGAEPWLAGVYYVRNRAGWDSTVFLADMRPATPADLEAVGGVVHRGMVAAEGWE